MVKTSGPVDEQGGASIFGYGYVSDPAKGTTTDTTRHRHLRQRPLDWSTCTFCRELASARASPKKVRQESYVDLSFFRGPP